MFAGTFSDVATPIKCTVFTYLICTLQKSSIITDKNLLQTSTNYQRTTNKKQLVYSAICFNSQFKGTQLPGLRPEVQVTRGCLPWTPAPVGARHYVQGSRAKLHF